MAYGELNGFFFFVFFFKFVCPFVVVNLTVAKCCSDKRQTLAFFFFLVFISTKMHDNHLSCYGA